MSVPPESVTPSASSTGASPPPIAGGNADDRNLAMLTHLSGILFGFVVPLVVWLVNKDNAARGYLVTESKEALNFQITILIGYVVCWMLSIAVIGMLLLPLLWVANLVFCVLAAVSVSNSGSYRYPFALRLVN